MRERSYNFQRNTTFSFFLSILARKVVVVVDGWRCVVAVALLGGFFRGTVGPI